MIVDYLEKTYQDSACSFYMLADEALRRENKMFVVTANPEVFMIGTRNEKLHNILSNPSVTIVPDGIGVVKVMRQLGMKSEERITGVDLATHLLESANELGKSAFFYGAKPKVLSALLQKVCVQYPNLTIAGYEDGYSNNSDYVFEKIAMAKPDVIFVALGVPAQESFIANHISNFDKGIFIGVGGSFDVLSGSKARAPKIFIKLNLEWLYRIIKEPKRIGRFYRNNVKFFLAAKQKKE